MEYETILLEKHGPIAVITMNRPQKLNACNTLMFQEIDKALGEVEKDGLIKVLIIRGAGDMAFSAGVDIEELDFGDLNESNEFTRTDVRMFRHIESIPQPVIAAVNGCAYGYGCKIAIVSDITISSEKATFGLQGITLGAVHMMTLGRGREVLGRSRLGYMLLSGEVIDAYKAESFGIVNKVVPHGRLYEETFKLARKISVYPEYALYVIKKMLHRGMDDDYRYEDLLTPPLLLMEDLKEGRRKFLEKKRVIQEDKIA